jgi:hypothetical protein
VTSGFEHGGAPADGETVANLALNNAAGHLDGNAAVNQSEFVRHARRRAAAGQRAARAALKVFAEWKTKTDKIRY